MFARKFDNRRNRGDKLPRNAAKVELTISYVGGRGDGVGSARYKHNHITDEHSVFVPATLAGEQVVATPLAISGQGIRAVLHEIIMPSPERREPDCAAWRLSSSNNRRRGRIAAGGGRNRRWCIARDGPVRRLRHAWTSVSERPVEAGSRRE
tara:strand:+ start:578 stop:1033 length:456 start_codon:yes stop_codon:yes gene_type:complete